MNTTSVTLDAIRIDGGTQARAELNQMTVAEYADAMAEGAKFPPVVVFFDGVDNWLADGFHRYFGAKKINARDIEVDVRDGTKRDAILFSLGANANHGLRRTNADKRKAVETLLADPEWVKWPDTEIAQVCGVGRHFVRAVRKDLTCTPNASDGDVQPTYRKYINKHGQESVMNVARIGSSQSKTRQLTEEELRLLATAPAPCVYVLHDGNVCKIGWSRYPRQRVEGLLSQSPYATVIAVAAGGNKEERMLHKEFACERDSGEWFVVKPEDVVAAIERLGLQFKTKHGTTATMKTGNVGRTKEKPEQAAEKPQAPAPHALATLEDEDLADAMGADPVELLNDLQRENEALLAQIKTLTAEDTKAELHKMILQRDHAVRQQSEAMDRAALSQKREKRSKHLLMRCGKAVGEEDPEKIPAIVEAMARTYRKAA